MDVKKICFDAVVVLFHLAAINLVTTPRSLGRSLGGLCDFSRFEETIEKHVFDKSLFSLPRCRRRLFCSITCVCFDVFFAFVDVEVSRFCETCSFCFLGNSALIVLAVEFLVS